MQKAAQYELRLLFTCAFVSTLPQGACLMLAVAYRFYVLPRHRDAFRHAWQAARDTLSHTIGLHTHDFVEPRDRHEAFTLQLAWDNQSSFERFTRTWIGVWMVNGMGLARDAFASPIETRVDTSESVSQPAKRVV
jgi:quinol monooxygenase YgiN